MLSRFWRWLGSFGFMRPPPSQKSPEEELGLAILAIVDKYNLQAGQGFRGDCFAIPGYEMVPPIHFMIEVCNTPEICFGLTLAEGVTIQ